MPITYHVPNFNLTCKVWYGEVSGTQDTYPYTPPSAGTAVEILAELYGPSRIPMAVAYRNKFIAVELGLTCFGVELRVPKDTASPEPLVFNQHTYAATVVHVPGHADGRWRFFIVAGEIVRHMGFPNEYKAWALIPYFSTTSNPY